MTDDSKDDLTVEEIKELEMYLNSRGSSTAPTADPKYNTHTFLNMIAQSKDTLKLGNLKDEELGYMTHTVRTNKVAALIADEIMGNKGLSDYYNKKAELTTASSLSRTGFLARLAVVTKKEIADVTPEKKENKGWFKKKENNNSGESG